MSGAFEIQNPQEQSGVFPSSPPAQAQQPATPPAATTPEQAPPPAGDNVARFQSFMVKVRSLGSQSAKGKEALPNLVVAIVEAINDGSLDPKGEFKRKNGDKCKAAEYILEAYGEAEGKVLMHERTPLSKKTATSKIEQIIKAARNSDYNFAGALKRAPELRDKCIAQNDKKKIKPVFEVYVSMARKQNDAKKALTDEDIMTATVRQTTSTNDLTKELKRMYSRLTTLLSEQGAEGGTIRIDASSEIRENMDQIHDALLEAIRVYDPNFGKEEPAPAQAQEAGVQAAA